MLSTASLVGRTLGGQYRVDRLLGQGGFGAVFAAWDIALDRPVAVKVIAGVAAERLADRFRREAQVQARLRHPTTVRLLSFGEDDGLHFMVQELVEGQTLRAVIDGSGPLAPARARRIFGQLLDALDEAHGIGVVHRDLKPENIMLVEGRRGEEARLLDFGIAKIVDDEGEALTASGMLVGTAAWLSPEQAEARPVTPRSDLYALGCVLYFALTGRRPFTGTALQLVLAHSRQDPPPLPETVPRALAAVVCRAMQKAPDARFADAAAMAAALREQAAGETGIETGAHLPATLMLGGAERVGGAERLPPPLDPSSAGPGPADGLSRADSARPVSAETPRPAPPRGRRRPGPLSALVILLAVGGLATMAFAPLFDRSGPPPEPVMAAAESSALHDPEPTGPAADHAAADAADPDSAADAGRPPDAARPRPARAELRRPPQVGEAPARPSPGQARFESELRRCACDRAERRLAALGRDARDRWREACAPASGGRPAGRCGRDLLARLDAAMTRCPCHGPENKALVERLRTRFGIDRERAWSHRCTIPGLPGSCLTP